MPTVHSAVQGDLLSLKQSIQRQLQLLDVSAAASVKSVARLKDIDQVKGRLEDACSTLKVPAWSTHVVSNPVRHLLNKCPSSESNMLQDCKARPPAKRDVSYMG